MTTTYRITCPRLHHFYINGSSSHKFSYINVPCPVCIKENPPIRTQIILSGIVDEKIPICPEDEVTIYVDIVEDILCVVAMSWDPDTRLTGKLLADIFGRIVCKTYEKVVKDIKKTPDRNKRDLIIQETQLTMVTITEEQSIDFNMNMTRETDYPADLGNRKLSNENKKSTSSILKRLKIISDKDKDSYKEYLKALKMQCIVKYR